MISAKELMAKNTNVDKEIDNCVEIICQRIEKKFEDSWTKKFDIPARLVKFNYDELFTGLKYTSTAIVPKLTQKLNSLGYRFNEHSNMCPNGSWHTMWHLTW